MVRDADYYVNYVNKWMEENKNKGCGCTYWHAMYEAIRNWWVSFEWLWIREQIENMIVNDSWASEEWVSYLDDKVLAELVDLDTLNEYWISIEEEWNEAVDEDDKEYIYWELDKKEFKTREELDEAVKELVSESWNDRLNWATISEDYENDNFLDFDED